MMGDGAAEVRRAIDAVRFPSGREQRRLEAPRLGVRVAAEPCRAWDRLAECEIVRIRGCVPKAFFVWFENRLRESRRNWRMLDLCWFEEVDGPGPGWKEPFRR
jgi:hypothetical protein